MRPARRGAEPTSPPRAVEEPDLGYEVGGNASGPPTVTRVIRTAELSVVIPRDAFDERFGQAVDVAEEQGGFVADSRTRNRSGSLTVRVPAANFDETLHALRALGTVEVESVHGRDVTADYVDLHANLRIARARREVLLGLMADAVSIEQTIRVQNALDETQLRIEQLQGQLRLLDDRTSLATIDLRLREQGVEPGSEVEKASIPNAFERAAAGFVGVIAAIVIGLGYLLPLAVLGLVVWFVVDRVRGRRSLAGSRHISRRPSRACDRVTSSAYSRSPPTGRPLASRVTRAPNGFSIAATYIAVALPSRFGLVARIDLGDAVALHAVEQLLHAEILGADAVERADRAAEHVVAALDHAGLLDRGESFDSSTTQSIVRSRPSSRQMTSSAYSRSPPTGQPARQPRHPRRRTASASPATYIAVALPSRFGLVAQDHLGHAVALQPRSSSSCTRRSSGPIPSSGLIAPPSTWYRPLITPAFSIVETSLGSSTTQSIVRSRPSSRQMRQSSPSATLPHSLQKKMRSFAWTIDSASRLASSGGAFTRWNASRCADFGPMPGRRESSSIRSWIGPSYT